MRLLEAAIAAVSPAWAARRAAWREAGNAVTQLGAFKGASSRRNTYGWVTQGGSPDADINDDLPALRARSRDLVYNDGRAAGVINTLVTSVVGTGIRPQCRLDAAALGITEEMARQLERQIEAQWRTFCRHADAGRRLDFYGLQRQCYWSKKANGEYVVLPQRLTRPGRKYELCLYTVEPDRLDSPRESGDRTIYGGVEVGRYDNPIAYWIRKTHPGEAWPVANGREEFRRIPAEDEQGRPNVLHEFDVLRPGQTRGVPSFAPVLEEFKDLADYREAERYAMRLSACIGLIINSPSGVGLGGGGTLTTIDGNPIEGFEPGMIWRGTDLDIQQINPQRPGSNFEMFIRDVDRTIGNSQGIGYELAAKWFSDANYSSLRAAFVEARRYYRVEQEGLVHHLCQPVWEAFLDEAVLRGFVRLPRYWEMRDLWASASWVPMGWDWVDPLKEAQAADMAIRARLTTRAAEIARRTGEDWETVLRQVAVEEDLMEELGIDGDTQETSTGSAAGSGEDHIEEDGHEATEGTGQDSGAADAGQTGRGRDNR